uniref:Uncharacterized protein n=1 Tax=Arundo donax TaxID=35708 RepID=A0A0A9CGY1_ARUDO
MDLGDQLSEASRQEERCEPYIGGCN